MCALAWFSLSDYRSRQCSTARWTDIHTPGWLPGDFLPLYALQETPCHWGIRARGASSSTAELALFDFGRRQPVLSTGAICSARKSIRSRCAQTWQTTVSAFVEQGNCNGWLSPLAFTVSLGTFFFTGPSDLKQLHWTWLQATSAGVPFLWMTTLHGWKRRTPVRARGAPGRHTNRQTHPDISRHPKNQAN